MDIDVLSIDELQSSLIIHEQKFQKSSGEEQALKVTSEDRFYGRGQGKRVFRGGGRGGDIMLSTKPLWSVIGVINLATFNMNVPQRLRGQIMLKWIMKKRYC
jgi:hypothetical protein